MSGGFTGREQQSYEPERFYSYGLNYNGTKPARALGWVSNDSGNDTLSIRSREPPTARVKKPEAMIAVADTGWANVMKYQALIRPNTLFGPVGNLHRGGSNVLWCDGHVDWRRMEEISYTEEEEQSNALKVSRVGPFWNASHSMR
jgi:prepilin-type processing-associated H-X9-DG protein